jgi:hypothetical protein
VRTRWELVCITVPAAVAALCERRVDKQLRSPAVIDRRYSSYETRGEASQLTVAARDDQGFASDPAGIW